MAQGIRINEGGLEGKTQECVTLAEAVEAREEPFDAPSRERIITAINSDDQAECAAIVDQLQTGSTETASQESSETLTEEVDLSEQVEIEGDARVTVPEPDVDVEVPAPNVRVTEQQPQIDVTQEPAQIELRQARPQIEVEIPEIVVRVDIPAPEIYILQPNPDVRISQADPQVEVSQGEPVVSVRQGEPQLNVDIDLDEDSDQSATAQTDENSSEAPVSSDQQSVEGDVETAGAEPQVEIVEAEGQPQMSYESGDPSLSFERAEPRIAVMMAEQPTIEVGTSGEPVITVETPEEREQRRQAQAEQQQDDNNAEEQPASAEGQTDAAQPQSPQGETMTVGDLLDMDVVTSGGEELGAPDAVVEINGQPHLVVADGGFLGIGEKQVPVPIARVSVREDRLVLSDLTEEEIEAANDFDYDSNLELADDQTVNIGQ
ncbi:PRC-barrel domain-containing protein [Paracoccus albicereus]|nr:PRC-barrel domain-containing protein [Paracoccus albicereus]